jgi:hypothetical protein
MPRGKSAYYGRHFDARCTKDPHGDMGVLQGDRPRVFLSHDEC